MFIKFLFFLVIIVIVVVGIVMFSVVIMLVLMFVFSFHALFYFFCLCPVTHDFHHVNNLNVLVAYVLKRILYPTIAFSANINKNIAFRNFYNVLNRWLVTVQIHTLRKKHRQVCIVLANNLFCPIISRENCCHNLYL